MTTKKRTLVKIRKEDPVSYVILLMKGEYEGSVQYAHKEWGDPINDMEGWSSYRESAVWSLENKGEGIPLIALTTSSGEYLTFLSTDYIVLDNGDSLLASEITDEQLTQHYGDK